MPQYLRDHAVYYAGPAKTPEGYASGSFGPTTAGRMDSYVEKFQAAGGSLVMLAKGNRSAPGDPRPASSTAASTSARSAARRPGWPRTASSTSRCWNTPELGMEAVWKIEVEDFPAFIVVDDKGNDFFAEVTKPVLTVGAVTVSAEHRSSGAGIRGDTLGRVATGGRGGRSGPAAKPGHPRLRTRSSPCT